MRKIKVNETLESTPISFLQHITYVGEFYNEIDSRIKYAASRGTVDSLKDAITSHSTEWWISHDNYDGKDINDYKIKAKIKERWIFNQENYKPGYWYKHMEDNGHGTYDLPSSKVSAYFDSQLGLEQILALYYLMCGEDTFYKEAVSWAAVACEFWSRYNDSNWQQYSVFELADMVARERNRPIWKNKKNVSEELSTDAYYEKVSRLAKKPYVNLGEKLEREFGLPTSQDELSKLIREWFDYQDYADDEQAFDYAMAYYLSEYGNDYVFRGALDDVIDNMEASGYIGVYENQNKKYRRHNKKLFENSRNSRKSKKANYKVNENKRVNYKVNENSRCKRFKRLPTFESYLNSQKRRKIYESLSDFVYGNYPSYRIEEFNNGTVALLGFNNFTEIEELANKFRNDEDFIEIAEFETKSGGNIRYVGHEVTPFNLYTKALNGEFHNGKHIEEVGNDKFSVTCDGCDEPYAIYDKKSVDYEFDGTRRQIGILFKAED